MSTALQLNDRYVKGRPPMTVRIEKNGSVWTVIHDRPEARNAMDPASADALTAAFLEFDADKNASVAVFYGAGGAFCAGWDLKYVSTLNADYPLGELDISTARPQGNGGDIPRGPLGPSRLELDKPVIGAIEGPAVAGGMELGLWCDFRVMAKESYFGVYCRR
jgi:enoyl-CoA hydratase